MNHKEQLILVYNQSQNIDNIQTNIPKQYLDYLLIIANNCYKQKGVFTVLVTLLVHKLIDSNQDIRLHQSNMQGGFSGRTIDTQYITPTLRELGLPAMAESGWLTRSLEQPHPYNLQYAGKISNKLVKNAFLHLIDFVQNNSEEAEIILRLLLYNVIKQVELNKVPITRIHNIEKLDITTIVNALEEHFSFNYGTHGAAKLPVLAFYAIYKSFIQELARYHLCKLEDLKSHRASDLKAQSAGDIEIVDSDNNLIEAIEIKYGKEIDLNIINIAKEKIFRFNPQRYCIFSSANVKNSETDKIQNKIREISRIHGCQVIVNGILPTLKYYLRLLTSVEDFINDYSHLLELDNELQEIHKTTWNQILSKLNDDFI